MRSIRPLAVAIVCALAASTAGAATPDLGEVSRLNVADLDHAISPCTDLNGFVNHNWLARTQIPADRTSWGSFEMLGQRSDNAQHRIVEGLTGHYKPGSVEQIVGDFYASGMDTKAINATPAAVKLKPYLARIDALKTPADIAAYIDANYAKGMVGVFGFGGAADFKDSSMVIGYAAEGGYNLPERAYYLEDQYKPIRDAYVAHIGKTLELGGVPAAQAKQQAAWVMAMETDLARASLSPIEARDTANQYKLVTIAQADAVTPHFSWQKFFDGIGVPGITHFSSAEPKFFAEFDKLLATAPIDQWQAYLRYQAIDSAAPFLDDALATEHFDFYNKTLHGQQEQKPRWKRVLGTVNMGAGEALGQLYVKDYFTPEAKAAAEQLVDNLRQSLKARIAKLDWMSAETKQKAMEKWSTFMPKIGYPSKWRDWTGLKITRDDYLGNVLAAGEFNTRWQLGKIGHPVDRTEWGMTPQTVNAYYNPQLNEIVFPAAILQPPFFDAKADPALNYGGIGAVIGHEMSHGYDDQGSQFDARGNQSNWWTDADKKGFMERTSKLVQQFDDYVAYTDKDGKPVHVKGALTLGENIADLGGINIAYDALMHELASDPHYKPDTKVDGYTETQRFFMNFGNIWRRSFKPEELAVRVNTDPHAPAQFRADGAPSNMPAFAQAFSCKAGDPMVRPANKQVVIW
ncbi:MAG: M13 family metallopeptidase [Proteobacteria bacterium]|nr:M13 family metallopeptidase [Pseudomonadota bacterium]